MDWIIRHRPELADWLEATTESIPCVNKIRWIRLDPYVFRQAIRASPPRGVNRGCKPNFHPAQQNLCPTGGSITGEINHLPRGIQLNNLDVTNFYTSLDRPAMQQHSPIEI
ncbi:hypothetical protein PCASD_10560 [Puccinia coronata f. sp. avenae]|uniref:Uncharacterized protein n=1 Tax=Puccinia coronata f. sp. avenae TaxID=200324 RepID=A0A2N5UL55_9BASI|nr:hypothetical protein PCASD_23996 [Puccinia coronata f. sp. avenae]PLW38377.1 hypothetical protein PCASD_10560 [Puccinia coronata f. sp. avenae]